MNKSSATNLRNKSSQDIIDLVNAGDSSNNLSYEIRKRNDYSLYTALAKQISDNSLPKYLSLFFDFLKDNSEETAGVLCFLNLLKRNPLSNVNSNEILLMANLSDKLSAVALISEAGASISDKICLSNNLDNPKSTSYLGEQFKNSTLSQNENNILKNMTSLLRQGISWKNNNISWIARRLNKNSQDPFVTEITKYDVPLNLAQYFLKASTTPHIGDINKAFRDNVNNNEYQGMKLAKGFSNLHTLSVEEIAELIVAEENPETIKEILNNVQNAKTATNIINLSKLMAYPAIFEKVRALPDKEFLYSLLPKLTLREFYDQPAGQQAIEMLEQEKRFDILQQYPQSIINNLELQPTSWSQMKKDYSDIDEVSEIDEDLKNIFASNNWYKSSLQVEAAGTGEKIAFSLLLAIWAVMSGSSLMSSAQRYKISEEQLEQALQDQEVMDYANQNYDPSYTVQQPQVQQPQVQQPQVQQQGLAQLDNNLLKDLIKFEGSLMAQRFKGHFKGGKFHTYNDHLGNPTIGYGHLIVSGENFTNGITNDEALKILTRDASDSVNSANDILKNHYVSAEAATLVAQMVFQMGKQNVLEFEDMLEALSHQDYKTASEEMLKSDWNKQTPGRAKELSNRMSKIK